MTDEEFIRYVQSLSTEELLAIMDTYDFENHTEYGTEIKRRMRNLERLREIVDHSGVRKICKGIDEALESLGKEI